MENLEPKEKSLDYIKSTEEAVTLFTSGEWNENDAISYLKENKKETAEFCLQVIESYSEKDKTGAIRLGMIIEKLLEK